MVEGADTMTLIRVNAVIRVTSVNPVIRSFLPMILHPPDG